MDIEFVRSRFIKHFDGKTGNIYASPGRINLIGEHTDYNGGFVFPGAVDKGIMAEVRPNGLNTVIAYSIDLKDKVEFKVDDPVGPKTTWARYIYGIVQEMKKLGVDERALIQHLLVMFLSVLACLQVQLSKAALHMLSTIFLATTRFQSGTWHSQVRLQSTTISV